MLFLELAQLFPLSSFLPVLSNKLLNLSFCWQFWKYWKNEAVQEIPCDTLLLPLDHTLYLAFCTLTSVFKLSWMNFSMQDVCEAVCQIPYLDRTASNLLHSLPFLALWHFQNRNWTCLESYFLSFPLTHLWYSSWFPVSCRRGFLNQSTNWSTYVLLKPCAMNFSKSKLRPLISRGVQYSADCFWNSRSGSLVVLISLSLFFF